MPRLPKAMLLGSSTTTKDTYFEAKRSNGSLYSFAFKLLIATCRHPRLFGDAADKDTWESNGSAKPMHSAPDR